MKSMDETKKMINWVAGMMTIVVTLLIVIVLLEPHGNGVSCAAASRAIALALNSADEIEKSAPETTYFSDGSDKEWYGKYMDYLYETGYLNPEECPAKEERALAAVTYGELSGFAAALGKTGGEITAYITEAGSRKAKKAVGQEEFWKFYDSFRKACDPDGNVKKLETDIYGTPGNVEAAAAWTAYTSDGKFRFDGLYMDSYIDRRVELLVRDREIIKVERVVSDAIVYSNAWISGCSGNTVTVFIGNIQRKFPVKGVLKNEEEITGQIGDLYLKKGRPQKLVLKKDSITGTVLSVRENEIEIEGYGLVPLSEDFKVYRTFGVLREQQKKDILVGYHAQIFVVAGGEICAALTTEKPDMENIRILLMTSGFKSLFHSKITVSCDSAAILEYGSEKNKTTYSVPAGEAITIESGDPRLSEGRMSFRPTDEGGLIRVESIERAQGIPVYPGHIEITAEENGLLLLNEVNLEEYLKRVIPSEMPSTYEIEALKAQAICARTYAWKQIQGNTYSAYGAHVDDSTNFQVYNNTGTFDSTDAAVNETFGQMLVYEGEPVEAFYYSTSCGHSTDGTLWGAEASSVPYLRAVTLDEKGKTMDLSSNDAFGAFIKRNDVQAFDSDFAMFRWNTVVTGKSLSEKIDGIGKITGLTITSRGPGGIAKALKVVGTEGTKTYTGQSRIRSVLGSPSLVYNKKDGSTITGWDTLPSGFIYIENEGTDENNDTRFVIYGGGYGHGVGMSQNGAQGMAKQGKNFKEILQFFYSGCELEDIGEILQ